MWSAPCPVIGNGAVNTSLIEEDVFYVVRASAI
jgi:hypothetical protein